MNAKQILINAAKNAKMLANMNFAPSTTATTAVVNSFGGFTTTTTGNFTTVAPTISYSGILASGVINTTGSGYGSSWFAPPIRVTLEVFKAHTEIRRNKVLVLYNKLDKTREIIPVTRVIDLIFRFACQMPMTVPTNPSERILFEFNDEEFELVFEKPRDKNEKKLSLQLTPDMIYKYHKEKNEDIEYQL